MTARQSLQRGFVSDPMRDRAGGTKFVIRYRLRSGDGKWVHKSETLHGLTSKKAARAVLQERITKATDPDPIPDPIPDPPAIASELTLQKFIDDYWRPRVDRSALKPSTRSSYESG